MKSKELKRQQAIERQKLYDSLTVSEKIAKLPREGAKKQVNKLLSQRKEEMILDNKKSNSQKKGKRKSKKKGGENEKR